MSDVVFTRIPDPDVAFRWDLTAGGEFVGAVIVRVNDIVSVSTGFPWADAVDLGVATQVLATVRHLGRTYPDRRVGESILDPLVRHVFRYAGYTGPLRGHLWAPPDLATVPEPESDVEQLRALLPHLDVVLQRESKRATHLCVSSPDDELQLRVTMERRPILVEQVAMVLDTATAVQRSLAPHTRALRKALLGDVAREQLTSKVLGRAHDSRSAFSINGGMLYLSDLVEHREEQFHKGRRAWGMRDPWHSRAADLVTAHEAWHLVDQDVMGSARNHIAFHRALGEELGVDTLEHALRGRERGAPPAWRDAHAELARQLREYATKNQREATAEMFATWWCSTTELPPVVARFASLVHERLGHEMEIPDAVPSH
jgi:hypothetical protein